MIVRKRCPHTGDVNFYFDTEPHLPVGSISLCGTVATPTAYTWRSYSDEEAGSGRVRDARTAENTLLEKLAHLTSGPVSTLA